MKRWIHAATMPDVQEENGWVKKYDSEFREWYHEKEVDGYKCIMDWKENDGDGYYSTRIYQIKPNGSLDRLEEKYIYPLQKAKDWADSLLNGYSKYDKEREENWFAAMMEDYNNRIADEAYSRK